MTLLTGACATQILGVHPSPLRSVPGVLGGTALICGSLGEPGLEPPSALPFGQVGSLLQRFGRTEQEGRDAAGGLGVHRSALWDSGP